MASSYGATGDSGHSTGSAWGDLDDDGHIDLLAGNFSHPGQPQSQILRNRGPSGGYRFENRGTGGIFWQESYTSPSLADYGNDGDLDLAAHGRVYLNNSNSNNWLKVRLQDVGSDFNAAAIGAQVRVTAGGKIITRQVESGTGQGNQNDLTLHFGLGRHSSKVDVEVAWPNGEKQTLRATPNETILVRYGESPPPPPPPEPKALVTHFDFGTKSSPVQDGYEKVTDSTAYSASRRYGWKSGTISSHKRKLPSDPQRDLNATTSGTFAIDVSDGDYDIALTLTQPDSTAALVRAHVVLEDVWLEPVTLQPAELKQLMNAQVTMADGQLTIDLESLDDGAMVSISELVIRNAESLRFDFGKRSSPVASG